MSSRKEFLIPRTGVGELQVEFSARGHTSYAITPRSKGELVSHYGHVTALPRMVASNVLIKDRPWDAAVYYL